MTAARIWRRHTRGWRAPDGAVPAARTGRNIGWGNPYRITSPGDAPGPADWEWSGRTWWPVGDATIAVDGADHAVDLYRELVLRTPQYQADARATLAGKDLMCWCRPGEPCHADLLLRIANGEPW